MRVFRQQTSEKTCDRPPGFTDTHVRNSAAVMIQARQRGLSAPKTRRAEGGAPVPTTYSSDRGPIPSGQGISDVRAVGGPMTPLRHIAPGARQGALALESPGSRRDDDTRVYLQPRRKRDEHFN